MFGEAKVQTEIDGEKEMLETSIVQAMGKNKYGDVTQKELEEKLNSNAGEGKTEVIADDDNLIVKFIESNRYYEIDNAGNINDFLLYEDNTPGEIAGSGTETEPYRIESIEDLLEWSKNYSKYYGHIELERSLNFNSIFSYNDYTTTKYGDLNEDGTINNLLIELTDKNGIGFKPIGSFSGTFDGHKHEIQNIYINKSGGVGLFDNLLSDSLVENIGITGEIVSNNSTAGGIANCCGSNVKFLECYSSCTINANNYAGGIVGSSGVNQKTYFINCYNKGNITSENSYAGGIVAYNHGSAVSYILNCYNEGNINGKDYAGGIQGRMCGYIFNSYNTGNITSSKCGGITGHNSGGKLENVYNVGAIKNTSDVLGAGISSWIYGSINLDSAYYLNNVKIAQALNGWEWTYNSVGRGASTKQYMQSQEFVNALNEYVDNYKDEDDLGITLSRWIYNKNGYPILSWQSE